MPFESSSLEMVLISTASSPLKTCKVILGKSFCFLVLKCHIEIPEVLQKHQVDEAVDRQMKELCQLQEESFCT